MLISRRMPVRVNFGQPSSASCLTCAIKENRKTMAILVGLLRGTTIAAAIMLAFALLKKFIIVFGFIFAILKFAIVLVFLALLISIAVAMLRDWNKSSTKDA